MPVEEDEQSFAVSHIRNDRKPSASTTTVSAVAACILLTERDGVPRGCQALRANPCDEFGGGQVGCRRYAGTVRAVPQKSVTTC
jgi:hypothetical protein